MKTSIARNHKIIGCLEARQLYLNLILILATLLAYWGVWNCAFINYDDNGYFYNNHHVLTGLKGENLLWAFTNGETANWHPVTWISLILDATLFGSGASAPHLVNLVLHIANTLLLFGLLRFLTGACWRSFLVAIWFGLHPMHVESVAWVAERKDVLSAFFFMLTLLAYAHYVKVSRKSTSPFKGWYWAALGLFTLGLMSKPMLVTVPFLLFLLDWWPLQRFQKPHDAETGGSLMKSSEIVSRTIIRPIFLEKIPFLLLGAGICIVTFLVQREGGAVAKLTQFTLAMRVENTFVSYARYFGKTIFPSNLAVPYPFVAHWPGLILWSAIAFFLLTSTAAVWLSRRYPFFFTGWFWFAGMLVPVIGLVHVGGQSMADRYNYLPSIGIFIIIVWGGTIFLHQLRKFNVPVMILGGVGGLLLLGVQTHKQTSYWHDDGKLFGHSLKVTQNNYIACINYGAWLAKNGDFQGAWNQYQLALQLNPQDCNVLYDLGNNWVKLGGWDQAIKCYRDALAVKPDQADILNNLGFAQAATKQYAEAVTNFELSLRLNPDYGDAHNNLASILFRQGDFDGAASHFYLACKLMPDNAQVQVNLGDVLLRLGQSENAVACYRRALELEPNNEQVRAKLKAMASYPSN